MAELAAMRRLELAELEVFEARLDLDAVMKRENSAAKSAREQHEQARKRLKLVRIENRPRRRP